MHGSLQERLHRQATRCHCWPSWQTTDELQLILNGFAIGHCCFGDICGGLGAAQQETLQISLSWPALRIDLIPVWYLVVVRSTQELLGVPITQHVQREARIVGFLLPEGKLTNNKTLFCPYFWM
jgi:hypothetical protein